MAEETPQPADANKTPSGLPRIRTYAADLSSAIRTRGETLTSIVSAQKKRGERLHDTPIEQRASHTRFVVAMSALAVVLGVVVVAVAFFLTTKDSAVPALPAGIIFPNTTLVLEHTRGVALSTLLAEERNTAQLSLGEVERIVVTEDGVPLSASDTAGRLGIPNAIAREVVDIMVGIHAFDRTQPFIILSVVTYDRTFNAMLLWEKDMGRALGAWFAPLNAQSEAPNLSFSDAIFRNLDVRKSQDAYPVVYTYPARTLLVITTNEFTLREITTRLGSARR